MVVPVRAAGPAAHTMLQLADHNRPAALGEEQKREGRADFGVAFDGANADPGVCQRILRLEQHLATLAVPVVLIRLIETAAPRLSQRGEESLARHAADPL